jgi:copper chaperone
MSNIALKISGMSCGACVSHVTKALQNVAGVRTASVDLASQTARVEGEDLVSTALVSAVEEEGYGRANRLGRKGGVRCGGLLVLQLVGSCGSFV